MYFKGAQHVRRARPQTQQEAGTARLSGGERCCLQAGAGKEQRAEAEKSRTLRALDLFRNIS